MDALVDGCSGMANGDGLAAFPAPASATKLPAGDIILTISAFLLNTYLPHRYSSVDTWSACRSANARLELWIYMSCILVLHSHNHTSTDGEFLIVRVSHR